jgi:CheY-like chemotaxis protein
MNINLQTTNPEKSDSTKQTGTHAISGSPKRVLLVDADETSQERRAAILRKCGVEVTCADDIEHARLLWQADSFHLVMIDTTNATDSAVAFQKSIKEESPKQLVKFFVGRPGLLSDSPLRESPIETGRKIAAMKRARTSVANASKGNSHRPGIMNAASEMSTRRSLNRLPQADQASTKPEREISFGEAVRRAGGE